MSGIDTKRHKCCPITDIRQIMNGCQEDKKAHFQVWHNNGTITTGKKRRYGN